MLKSKIVLPILFRSKHLLMVGLMGLFWSSFSLPTKAESCVPLSVIGGKGHEVEKTVTIPAIPGFFGHNWNTDWAIPNHTKFSNYKAVVLSDKGGIFDVKMYLKYSDETADPFYEQNNIELAASEPLKIEAIGRRREQPYQVNLLVGGIKASGNKYRASVYGCR